MCNVHAIMNSEAILLIFFSSDTSPRRVWFSAVFLFAMMASASCFVVMHIAAQFLRDASTELKAEAEEEKALVWSLGFRVLGCRTDCKLSKLT